MGRSRTRDLLTLLSGGAAPTYLNFTCTTTAPNQTLTLQSIRATGVGITIDWGDGTTTDYASGYMGTHTRTYASAGTYTVRVICDINLISYLDLRDNKITWTVSASAPMPSGLTTLYLISLSGLTWTVGASAPMPSGLTFLHLYNLSGLTWTVGASAPMPTGLTYLYLYSLSGLTWTVGASAPMPSGLTFLYLISLSGLTWTVGAAAPMPNNARNLVLTTLGALAFSSGGISSSAKTGTYAWQIESSLNAANQDNLLADIYAQRATWNGATSMTLDILGGSNAAVNGIYQAQVPPTTGREYIYELINDSAAQGYKKWTTIQYQT